MNLEEFHFYVEGTLPLLTHNPASMMRDDGTAKKKKIP
jgi:hypothetical protein